ncbi:MAG TPA: PGPGW domain-containing protein [Dokdonella sp.]|uniref:PGPGW domain-containing protein n=1 Tax=Dokdonella sp. TaxID=2291710 RepID=UPI0025BECBDD|nr:PGPGW domain-containing protein [Dokdonella sp.]MBX3691259.1 hypothetical protein [Dokdonella sp.]HNR91446.1 PGPGW domain-containing protein [Dokdonella sp.]
MFPSLKQQWHGFTSRPAGRRFQMRWRAQRERPRGLLRKLVLIGLGVALLLAGTAMLVLPGPGVLVMIIGAALIGEESLFVARGLDRADVWIARALQRWRARRAAHNPRP